MTDTARITSHVIADISYRDERIVCTCGVVVTAPADRSEHDRHLPLVHAWEAHRREAGLVHGTGNRRGPRTGDWSMA